MATSRLQQTIDACERSSPRFRTIDRLGIRYAESEQREAHALLLSPWPESLFAFDQMWDRLAQDTHLVAVDLPGFGHSERRDSLLAPRAMGEFVIRVADEFGLENPHTVGPDIGTCPAVRGGRQSRTTMQHRGRQRGSVVPARAGRNPQRLGDRAQHRRDPQHGPAGSSRPRSAASSSTNSPRGVRRTTSPATTVSGTSRPTEYVRAYPTELPILGELLPQIDTPVQIIGGLRDHVVPPSNHRYLHQRLPNSKLDFLDVGHFTWEDAADAYAELVTAWWARGLRRSGATWPHKNRPFGGRASERRLGPAEPHRTTLHASHRNPTNPARMAVLGGSPRSPNDPRNVR